MKLYKLLTPIIQSHWNSIYWFISLKEVIIYLHKNQTHEAKKNTTLSNVFCITDLNTKLIDVGILGCHWHCNNGCP